MWLNRNALSDAHVRYGQSQLATRRDTISISLSLWTGEIWSVMESASEWLGALLGPMALRQPPVEYISLIEKMLGLEYNTVWYGHKKNLWVSMAVGLCLHVSLSLQKP